MADRKHIHIVGCSPRSGTTLMQEMMVTCFDIDEFCSHERSLFRQDVNARGVICTKSPREAMYARWAMRVNPDLYFIYMVRDPRDVIVSRHEKRPDIYYASLSFYLRADRHARQLADHPRFIAIRYEDLVCKPDEVQSRIMRQLPFLRSRHPFSEFHLHAKVSDNSQRALGGVRPPDAKSIGKWRQHLPRVAAQVGKFPEIAALIEHYGYEPDRGWLSALPAAEEKLAESAMRDYSGLAYEFRLKLRVLRQILKYWYRLQSRG